MSRVDKDALRPALRAYTERAIRELGAACPERPPTVMTGLRDWVRHEGSFILADREEPYWQWCILQSRDIRHRWPEYAAVERAIRSDVLLSTQVDTLVGTAMGAHRQEVDHVADRPIWTLCEQHGGFVFDEAGFEEALGNLVDEQERTEYESLILGPLTGLKGDAFPLQLNPRLAIVEFEDADIVSCLRMNLLRPQVGMPDWVQVDRVVGIRVRLAMEKVVGDQPEQWASSANAFVAESMTEAESALDALRIFKKGPISLAGLTVVTTQDNGGWRAGGGPHPIRGGFQWGDYELNRGEGDSFVAFWRQLALARKRKLLDAAMRRFSYAADRHRPDDRLVDLVIAAESLFLGDTGDPQERTELRYRFSLRAAVFLEGGGVARRSLFRFMRNGYDARSAIVHGGEPKAKLLKGIDGTQLSLAEYADAMEEVLRRALRKAADASQQEVGPLVDWDELIMGAGSAHASDEVD